MLVEFFGSDFGCPDILLVLWRLPKKAKEKLDIASVHKANLGLDKHTLKAAGSQKN